MPISRRMQQSSQLWKATSTVKRYEPVSFTKIGRERRGRLVVYSVSPLHLHVIMQQRTHQQKESRLLVNDGAHDIEECFEHQNMTLQYGPNLGQPSVLLNEPTSYLGHTPSKNKNEMGCNWQVYSRESWSHRRHQRLEGQIQMKAN